MELEINMLSKISRKTNIVCFPHMWNLDLKNIKQKQKDLIVKGLLFWGSRRGWNERRERWGVNMMKVYYMHV
jgi:hypothetical protein